MEKDSGPVRNLKEMMELCFSLEGELNLECKSWPYYCIWCKCIDESVGLKNGLCTSCYIEVYTE